jgi:hypothetical protein
MTILSASGCICFRGGGSTSGRIGEAAEYAATVAMPLNIKRNPFLGKN